MYQNPFLKVIVGVLGIALIIFVGAETRNAFQQHDYIGKTGRDTITIDGEGKVTATPDVARFSLGVQTDGATVKEIQAKNTTRMNSIIDALKGLGIENKDIQTSNYSITPRYDFPNGKQTFIGYSVAQNVTVKIRNLDTVGAVLGKVGELGANQVGGIQFMIDDPQALQGQARLKAIEDARKKAEDLARAIGLTVVKVVTFSESSRSAPIPMMYNAMAAKMEGVAAPTPDIEAGSTDVISNVSVTFEVK